MKPAEPTEAAAKAKPAAAPPPAGSVAIGGMLMGAELQAAILQKRNQLKPVTEQGQQQQQQPALVHQAGGLALGAAATAGAASGAGLESVLRKGLERIHFDDDTGGNTAFMQAMLADKRKPS